VTDSPAPAPGIVVLEDRPCPLGCPTDDHLVTVGWDRLNGGPGRFRVVRCRTCGLMRTNPRPAPESMGLFYPDDYGPYVGTRVSATSGAREGWVRRVVRGVFRFNAQVLPRRRPGRLLEIGCASGAFLHEMAARGWEVEGIEFSATAAAAARKLGYRVRSGSLESVTDVDPGYDLVVGWMVLEHLHEPVAALRKLHEWTKPGSYLALSTPNAGSWERPLFGNRWYAFHLPAHLYHYTPRTIAAVLAAGGWKLERVFHQRLLGNLFGSLGYVLQDAGRFPRLGAKLSSLPERVRALNYVLYPLGVALASAGQTGRMTVWARRIDD
jgi:2-polyprenyl-3-methyl-5-hydroxy-6-metoxy-1,4-benzoquinol methylase